MSAIRGVVRDGKITLTAPPEWKDGTPVEVRPAEEKIGLTEDEWPKTPEEIEAWIAWLDSLEPIIMTPEEEANWQAARKEQKEFELATWEERSRKLEKLFE